MATNVIDKCEAIVTECTEYLSEHFMLEYVRDAVAQYIIKRENDSEIKPNKFFKNYFASVKEGTHILFRGFKYASATPYNRLCLLKAVIKIFKPFFRLNDRYDAADIHSLFMLVVPDFPLKVVEDAFTAYDNKKKDESNSLLFLDWIKAMKESFCTGPFDCEATIIEKQIEAKIDEYSNTPAEGAVGGNNPGATSFVNADYDSMPFPWNAKDTIDCAEFKRILTLKSSSDEDISGKLSESKVAKPKKKVGKQKAKDKKGAADKPKAKGKLPNKQLTQDVCLLEKGKNVKPRNASMPARTIRPAAKPSPTTIYTTCLGAVAKKPKSNMPHSGKTSRLSSETREASKSGAGAGKGPDGQPQPRGRPLKRQMPQKFDINVPVYDTGKVLGRRRSLSGLSNASSTSRRPWR